MSTETIDPLNDFKMAAVALDDKRVALRAELNNIAKHRETLDKREAEINAALGVKKRHRRTKAEIEADAITKAQAAGDGRYSKIPPVISND